MNTISPVYARLVLREMERNSIDTAPLFAGSLLTRQQLLQGGDIRLEDFLRILEVGRQSLDGEQLGLMLGRNMRIFVLGPLGAGMAVAPTIREGLQLMASHTRLHTTYTSVHARPSLAGLKLLLKYQFDMGDLEHFHTETAVMLFQHYIEQITGEPLVDAHYRLSIPSPADPKVYSEAIHGQLSFGGDRDEIEIPRHWLDHPSPYYHDELWHQTQLTLSKRLQEKGEQQTETYSQHVSALLGTSEPPLPELGQVAKNLLVSERTLNRRLQAEGVNFRQLKSRALASWAKIYLIQTQNSVESIAANLGYNDTANFRRAFRKSTGATPSEYRLANKRA
ncbi:MAG: AraC family transcriptional regulator ligand-binding domain-containing protein [Halioglobus sp.]